MSIIKSTPAQRVINGKLITTSEVSVVTEPFMKQMVRLVLLYEVLTNARLS
jgi:hypothetical protein